MEEGEEEEALLRRCACMCVCVCACVCVCVCVFRHLYAYVC